MGFKGEKNKGSHIAVQFTQDKDPGGYEYGGDAQRFEEPQESMFLLDKT